MSDELRAAAERLRQVKAGGPITVIYDRRDDLKDAFRLIDIDRRILADAWLAQNPADDAEPADAAFVRRFGTPISDEGDGVIVKFDRPAIEPSVRLIWEKNWKGDTRVCVGIGRDNFVQTDTRGVVRSLLTALRVPLTESP
jgi:hypothetical protein